MPRTATPHLPSNELCSGVGVGTEALDYGQTGDVEMLALAKISGELGQCLDFLHDCGRWLFHYPLTSIHIDSGISSQSQ